MIFEINSNTLIDEVTSLLDEYEQYRRQHKIKYPNGAYIYDSTPYGELRDYIGTEKTESKLNTITYLFRNVDIDSLARVVRKWYKRTNWEFCLSDKTADRLIELYIAKN